MAEHVPTYHAWMKDPEILALTASEPLSLEEEFAMCNTWADDEDKATFLIAWKERETEREMDPTRESAPPSSPLIPTRTSPSSSPSPSTSRPFLVGDVNLFRLHDDDDDDDDDDGGGENGQDQPRPPRTTQWEIEVMIGDPHARRRGLAREAIAMMMAWAVTHLHARRFVAKILERNHASRRLFEQLGFTVFKEVPVFEEIHLHREMI